MTRRARPLVVLLLVLTVLAGAIAEARRSGGGFGGSRSYRSSPFRAPSYRAPTYRSPTFPSPRVTPVPRYRAPYRQSPRSRYPGTYGYRSRGFSFFLPFFGLLPFAFLGGYGPGVGGLLLNVLLVLGVLMLLSRLLRPSRH